MPLALNRLDVVKNHGLRNILSLETDLSKFHPGPFTKGLGVESEFSKAFRGVFPKLRRLVLHY